MMKYLLPMSLLVATMVVVVPGKYVLRKEYEDVQKLLIQSEDDMFSVKMMMMDILAKEPNLPKLPELLGDLGLTELVSLVKKANLTDVLSSTGPFTVFGPTNAAVGELPRWAKIAIKSRKFLTKILTYHVLPQKVVSSALANEKLVETVNGKKLRINEYTVNDQKVFTAQCAPIDLTKVDQMASNGVAHVIKKVMLPPYGNLVDTVKMCPAFGTLFMAVAKTALPTVLSGDGPFTLFAPTNAAFAKVDPTTLANLLKNVTELTNVLKYHVVSGTYCSSGLSSGTVPTLLAGKDVTVAVSEDGVKVNNANVITADGSITNGVIHAIDEVLLPV